MLLIGHNATLKDVSKFCDEALDAFEEDHQYLANGDVFDEALIEKWIVLKRKESLSVATRPHPSEFEM